MMCSMSYAVTLFAVSGFELSVTTTMFFAPGWPAPAGEMVTVRLFVWGICERSNVPFAPFESSMVSFLPQPSLSL